MLFIFGDTHGEWKRLNPVLNKLYQKHKVNLDIIVCGDFGFWPHIAEYSLDHLKLPPGGKIWFCPGNHENWDALDDAAKASDSKIVEIYPNVFYCAFGAVREFEGRKFLFCGGAASVDKASRNVGIDWFAQETISEKDFYALPPVDKKIDVIISHTCPESLLEKFPKKVFFGSGKCSDPSVKYLEEIRNMYTPEFWFFGHWHKFMEFSDKNTKYFCLGNVDWADSKSCVKFETKVMVG